MQSPCREVLVNFAIQSCLPVPRTPQTARLPDLAAAIQEIFPMDTEDAILLWNRVPVRMGYKYDLSVMIDDLLPLLRNLTSQEVGSDEVHWASDTFRANWALQWNSDSLRIESTWYSVLGDYEELLNRRGHLEISLRLFVSEWKRFLRKVRDCLDQAQVTFVDATAWQTLCELTDQESRMD
jgi:hypothetical protein